MDRASKQALCLICKNYEETGQYWGICWALTRIRLEPLSSNPIPLCVTGCYPIVHGTHPTENHALEQTGATTKKEN